MEVNVGGGDKNKMEEKTRIEAKKSNIDLKSTRTMEAISLQEQQL
jgi:hypothetical protein